MIHILVPSTLHNTTFAGRAFKLLTTKGLVMPPAYQVVSAQGDSEGRKLSPSHLVVVKLTTQGYFPAHYVETLSSLTSLTVDKAAGLYEVFIYFYWLLH